MSMIQKGKAGRCDYGQWDKVASKLEKESEEEEKQEIKAAKEALGSDKYAHSQDHANEIEKAKKLEETKKKLDNFKKREAALVQTMTGLLGPIDDETGQESKSTEASIVRVTRDQLEEGKRVLVIADTQGNSLEDQIVITQDLSNLASAIPINPNAKSYAGDAENDASPPQATSNAMGLIKVNLDNLKNCSVLVQAKVISGTVEVHNCENVKVHFTRTTTVSTVQLDLSNSIMLHFTSSAKIEPRIYHAGVTDLSVTLHNSASGTELKTTTSYLKDGAVAVGNATPEEYRFVTHIVDGNLCTEPIVAIDGSSGNAARPMTANELRAAEERKAAIQKKVLEQAEAMLMMKDKDGNPLATKKVENDVVEPVYTNEVSRIVAECQADKTKGNEAFGAGEYAQAILQYSLALDKTEQLKDLDTTGKKGDLVPCDVLFTNRAACFLKLGEHEKAREDADKALEVNSDNLKAHFRRGMALHAMGQYELALPSLVTALRGQPKNSQILQAIQFCERRLAMNRN